MKKIVALLLLLPALLATTTTRAQVDPHFSQYYANPIWLNPGMTGLINGDYRITGNYRNQWRGIDKAFSTAGLSAEYVTNKNLNLGVNLLDQAAGSAGYHYTTAQASAAYTGVRFGAAQTQRIHLGIGAGIMNRRFDPSKLQFGDEWNPITGYNPGSTGEAFSRNSSTVFDVSAGALWFDATPGKKLNPFLGVSAAHLTRPEDPFAAGGEKEVLPVRWAANGGLRWQVSETWALTPHLLYLKQGSGEVKMVGAYVEVPVSASVDLMGGANYRVNDAVTGYLGLRYEQLTFGLSYDGNTSTLRRNAAAVNSFEISVSFTGLKLGNEPRANFICPRL